MHANAIRLMTQKLCKARINKNILIDHKVLDAFGRKNHTFLICIFRIFTEIKKLTFLGFSDQGRFVLA